MQTIKSRVQYVSPVTGAGRCPHCGGPAPTQVYITVLAKDNSAYIGDNKIILSKNLTNVLEALADAYPRTVTKEFLANRIYWEREPAHDKIFDVWICQLRKRLVGTSANIVTVWGQGWRLEIDGSTA